MDPALAEELRDIGAKIYALCTPWPKWVVSGRFLLADPGAKVVSTIVAHDSGGEEVLSFVPPSVVPGFLSKGGQSFVSLSTLSPHPLASKVTLDQSQDDISPLNWHEPPSRIWGLYLREELRCGLVSIEIRW
jgi:hypothetical protein